jgi:hypothetical protein
LDAFRVSEAIQQSFVKFAVFASGENSMSTEEKPKLPRCFLDITADGSPIGRVVVELRSDVVPKTAKTSALSARGEKL